MSKAMEEMIEETRLAERRIMAKKLIKLGLISLEQIAECSNLPLSEIEEMARTKSA